MKYIVLFFMCFPVYAGICRVDWVAPTERVGGGLLPISEISHFTLFIDGVARKDAMGNNLRLSNNSTRYMWWGVAQCPACESYSMTTTDTMGRESDMAVIKCDNPNPPTVCK